MNRVEVEQLADRLLAYIRTEAGKRFSLEQVGLALEAPTGDLRRAARQLEDWGYEVSLSEREVRLLGTPDALTATELQNGLKTEFVGKRMLAYRQVKSTNDIAAREGEMGAADGTVVVAEQQTEGRGRLGRLWFSPMGMGAYISILLRPDFPPDRAPGISLITALCLAETIEPYCRGRVKIKWPNDVLIDGKKTAGILTELAAERKRVNYIVVGTGINVRQTAAEFPDELAGQAISVELAAANNVARVPLVRTFLERFEVGYQSYRSAYLEPFLLRLRAYSSLIGQPVRLATGKGIVEGTAVDIDAAGCLLVKRGDRVMPVSSGEVTVLKH